MPQPERFPPSEASSTARGGSPPFYRVEQREESGETRHFVVHTASPRFVVEVEAEGAPGTVAGETVVPRRKRAVIRRVCVPNSWAGDYHRSARKLGAALAFYEGTTGAI